MEKFSAKKLNMTQVWIDDTVIPVTVLKINEQNVEEFFEHVKIGDKLRISGTSKAKGFQGVVKRHGFHGGPQTHGQKNRLRAPGSLGPTAPQRVIKGRKMAGRMGGVRSTVKNVRVAVMQKDQNILMVRGAVPGVRGGKIEIVKK